MSADCHLLCSFSEGQTVISRAILLWLCFVQAPTLQPEWYSQLLAQLSAYPYGILRPQLPTLMPPLCHSCPASCHPCPTAAHPDATLVPQLPTLMPPLSHSFLPSCHPHATPGTPMPPLHTCCTPCTYVTSVVSDCLLRLPLLF